MKNILHLFSRDVVSQFLEFGGDKHPRRRRKSKNFEFMAALLMQRVYEEQWAMPTMIGFYLKIEYANRLKKSENPNHDLLFEALESGIDENHQIDFAISTAVEENGSFQEFQLKRFGGQSTDDLISYLAEMKNKYAPIDAACLVALREINTIDLPRVRDAIDKATFPFSELMLIGVVSDRVLIVAGILPREGWSAYPLSAVLH
jgi:hypothetical protein